MCFPPNLQNARHAEYSDDMEEELNSRTLPKKQNGERATKSIMRPSRKIAEEKTRAKMLEASQNNGMYFFLLLRIVVHFFFLNPYVKGNAVKHHQNWILSY